MERGALSWPEKLLMGAAFLMFAGMIAATLGQVLFRYVLHIPAPWTEEAARSLFVMANLTGIAFAYREKEHIIVDFLFSKFSPSIQRAATIFYCMLILGFLFFWARGAWFMVERNWNVELVMISWFRIAYFYIWELGMITLLAIYILADIKKLFAKDVNNILPSQAIADKTSEEF